MPRPGDSSARPCADCGQAMYWTEAAVRHPDLLAKTARGVAPGSAYVDAYRCANGHTSKECPLCGSYDTAARANGEARRLPRLTRHQTDPINHLLIAHVQHQLGQRLRLAKFQPLRQCHCWDPRTGPNLASLYQPTDSRDTRFLVQRMHNDCARREIAFGRLTSGIPRRDRVA